jgi:hypothetical protein
MAGHDTGPGARPPGGPGLPPAVADLALAGHRCGLPVGAEPVTRVS